MHIQFYVVKGSGTTALTLVKLLFKGIPKMLEKINTINCSVAVAENI